jgi:hypothetical protein
MSVSSSSECVEAVTMEHYCTLFDRHFLPQGLALHESLMRQDPSCVLWVLCMDDETLETLGRLSLPGLRRVQREDVESGDVLAVKGSRSTGEYCWTLTSVFVAHLIDQHEEISRLTYLDADCYFFSSPRRILAELDAAGKDVLITPHAYSPEYDLSEESGVYCVQFLTFGRSAEALEILRRWRFQCIEWCFARSEQGRFGDQKYLDAWPTLYPDTVHVLEQTYLTMAPWNVERFGDRLDDVCMYHFHKFRLLGPGRAMLFEGFRVSGPVVAEVYEPYLVAVARAMVLLGDAWNGYLPEPAPSLGGRLSHLILRTKGLRRVRRFKRLAP